MSDLTARAIFADKIGEKISANPDRAKSINAIYKFDITGDDDGGTWIVDLTGDDDFVREGDGDADCTVTVSSSDFVDMWTGKLPGPQAFMMGKLKIQGDMGLAMKLGQIIG